MVGEVKMKKTILGIVIVGLVTLSILSLSLDGTAAYYSGSSYKGYRLGYAVLGEILKYYIHQSVPMLKIEAPKYVEEETEFTVHVYIDKGDACAPVYAKITFAGVAQYGSSATFTAPEVDKDSYYYIRAVYKDSLSNYNIVVKRILVIDNTIHADDIKPAIIQGKVFDSDTYKPISGVKIVSDTGEFTFTDMHGRYSIKVYIDKAKTVHLTAFKKGYSPRTIPVYAQPGKTTRFWNIWLTKKVMVLHRIPIIPPKPPAPFPHHGIAKKFDGMIKIITTPHPMPQQGHKIPLSPPDDGGHEGDHGDGWGYVH